VDTLPEDSDAPAILPSVVAIVVAHDPGEWFETTMASLAEQDYDQLAVLVIDAASTVPVRDRVAAVFPSALVRRLETNPGYGAATDEAVAMVQGAPFLLLCHDDVELAPNTVRTLVEEAYRSNAGLVGPKLVRWDAPREILQLGLAVDKTGYALPRVEVGEFDQEQHDSVRDVFALPSACLLVRSDLFRAIGGFDAAIDFLGDDVDLCWRAQVAGARVVIAPEARVCHLEALGDRRGQDDRRRLQARHRLRTMLVCYGWFHLLRVLPQAAFLALVEIIYALLVGRGRQARDVAGAWFWNLRRVASIHRARKALGKVRQVPDSDIRPLQVSGSGRLSALARGQIGRTGDDRLTSVGTAGRDLANFFRQGPSRASAIVWIGVSVFLIVGSRHLITKSIPAVGQFADFPGSPTDLVRQWVSGWSSAGLGSAAPNPTGFGVLGAAGYLFLGAMGLLRTVVILAMLPLGAFGAWRLLAPTRSRWSKLVALIVYVSIPVAYNAIALGHWSGLVLYGAAPWLLARLARASALPPYAAIDLSTPVGDDELEPPTEGISPRTRRQHVLALGVLLAIVTCLVPLAIPVVLIMAVGLVLGGLLGGSTAAAGRILGVALGGSIVAAILQLPWVLDFLPPRFQWSALGAEATSSTGGLDPLHLLRFDSGPLGSGLFAFAFLLAAALPLLIGRGWRLGWAIRGWALALTCWGILWAAEAGWLPYGPSAREVLLAPAAAGLAVAAGLGVTAFERDVSTTFSWRQVVSFVALGSLVLGALPAFGAMFNGRWFAPRGDFSSSLSFLDEEVEAAPFRVLWLGDPDVMPLSGWELEDNVIYATTDQGQPDVTNLWAGSSHGATSLLGDALDAAGSRRTNRLGRLLAPMGVQYVIVVEQLAPAPFSDERRPVPPHLIDTLDEQLDLEAIEVNPALEVYRNIAWAPSRAFLPDAEVGAGDAEALAQAANTDLAGLEVALPDEVHFNKYEGPVDTGDRVYLATASASGWQLRSGGETAQRSEAFGWANAFAVGAAGDATLRFRTPPTRYLLLGIQAGLWAIALFVLFRGQVGPRSRRKASS
jgi:GT2 family glycosyltransferase